MIWVDIYILPSPPRHPPPRPPTTDHITLNSPITNNFDFLLSQNIDISQIDFVISQKREFIVKWRPLIFR